MKEWLSNLVEKLKEFVHNILEHKTDDPFQRLIENAIWSVDFLIDMASDILEWINKKLESLLSNDAEAVDIVIGDALADFINEGKRNDQYTEITQDQLNAINKSVINVAMNGNNEIVDNQMIRSNGGLSQQAAAQFRGQPILKINIK